MDCSLALSWYFRDEITEQSNTLRERFVDEMVYVPALWPLEITNALLAALRRDRISESDLPLLLADLRELPDDVDRETDTMVWDHSIRIAQQYGLTIYDATYLELAMRKDVPIATLDKALAKACKLAAVEVL
jgi:predicted nucleic acid-binding protein